MTSASGNYKFTSADGLSKYVEFSAVADEKGTTTGRLSFSGQLVMSEQDAQAAGDPRLSGSTTDFYMKAEFSCLTVYKNRAVMGGTVKEAVPKSYVGRRVLLVVEDRGEDIRTGDMLTWIISDPTTGGWIPKDAERADDNGATLTWLAKDAERADDVGVRQPKSSSVLGCADFPLSSHIFGNVAYESGDIRVQP
jgi:putative transposon-encoded protein